MGPFSLRCMTMEDFQARTIEQRRSSDCWQSDGRQTKSMWWWSTRSNRLTRSLSDFAKIVEITDERKALLSLVHSLQFEHHDI